MDQLTLNKKVIMHRYIKIFFLFLLFFAWGNFQALAQTEGTKKAQELYLKADEAFVFGRISEALKGFEDAVAADPSYLDAHLKLVELYQNYYEKYEKAIPHYNKIIELDETLFYVYFGKAQCYFFLDDFDKAIENAKLYASKTELQGKAQFENNLLLESCAFAKNAMQDPVAYVPVNLGSNVNSEQSEYYPSITADNEWLYYTVNNSKSRYPNEDIYASKFENGEWQERKIVDNVNSENSQEGAHSITQDGRYLFFASDRKENNLGRFDIFIAKKTGDEWKTPVNMGSIINTRDWESQPIITANSRTIYFVRKSKDGLGGSDIYYSTLGEDGRFGKPLNLGIPINTMADEQRPYLHPDGKTLYFASNGHPGMGKSDIFKSTLQNDGTWSEPVNLGYPLNSKEEEYGLYVSADGNKGFISSSRQGGFGQQDIYSFDMPENTKPNVVVSVKGKVFDALDKKALNVNIKIIDVATAEIYKTLNSDDISGEFLLTLPSGRNYIFQANAEDYLPFSENFSLKNKTPNSIYKIEAPMQKIEIGKEFVLKNIFFDAGKFELQEDSKTELGILTNYLKNNSTIKIEIGGHTDNDGTEADNQTLSEKRAKSVYDYLITQGIPANSLSYKGYGETRAIVPNDTTENKAKNRRTAFKITAR